MTTYIRQFHNGWFEVGFVDYILTRTRRKDKLVAIVCCIDYVEAVRREQYLQWRPFR